MAIIKLGGDSGGGGNVLSRVLKRLQGKRVGRHPGLAELAPKVVLQLQQQFDCCEVCGGPHYSSDYQTKNQLVYEPTPGEPEGSDDYTEVPFDDEQILRHHYIPQVTPLAYTPPPPFLTTMEPTYTFLMGDEMTSDSNLESDMPINTPLPTIDVREENFDINSPQGEYVVDFLMENVDVAGLPRHLVKQLFSHLVKNPSLTKRMSDDPLGDDSKPRSYDYPRSSSNQTELQRSKEIFRLSQLVSEPGGL
ncbi:hypothetical protein Tco_0010484 [Tanacetum coccineum]